MRELFSAFRPNEAVSKKMALTIIGCWIAVAFAYWTFVPSAIIPRPGAVFAAFKPLWFEHGLGHHLAVSFFTNVKIIAISSVISLGLAYLSVVPVMRPLVIAIAKFRFLGFVGLTLLFTLATGGGSALKTSIMVFCLTVFYVTGMAQVVADIPKEAFDHARTLRMSEWRTVLEVVILGQIHNAFEVMKQNAAIGWMVLPAVEGLVRAEGGVGVLLLIMDKFKHLPEMFAIQILILVVGLFQDYGIGVTKNIVCPYARLTLERR